MVRDHLMFLTRIIPWNVFFDDWFQDVIDIKLTVDFGSRWNKDTLRLAALWLLRVFSALPQRSVSRDVLQ